MNKIELKIKLDLLDVDEIQYSLDGELIPDCIILFHNYSIWEVFYLDERGTRNDEKRFVSENDACSYIYKIFNDSKEIERKFGIK